MDFLNDFHKSDESILYINREDNKDRTLLHEIIRKYTNPRMVARSEYRATKKLLKCIECDSYNNMDNGSSEFNGIYDYFTIPGDSGLTCRECGEYNYYCNEQYELRELRRDGRLKLLDYRCTGNMIILKEPFKYPYEGYDTSYRKHYRSSKK